MGFQKLKFWQQLSLFLLIAALLRLVFILTLDDKTCWLDESIYHNLAVNLLSGNGYVDTSMKPTAYRPPGYPVFIAIIYFIAGTNLLAVRLVQITISLLTLVAVSGLSDRIWGLWNARCTAFICAIYPFNVYVPGMLLPTALVSLLLVFAVFMILQKPTAFSWFDIIGIGILVGLAILVWPTSGIIILVLAIWLWLFGPCSWLYRLKVLAGIILVTLTVIGPWFYRNGQKLNTWTIATNAGRNFWLGNNPAATGSSGNGVQLPSSMALELAKASSEVDKQQIYFNHALAFIKDHPGRFCALTLAKALNYWRIVPVPSSGYKHYPALSYWLSILSFPPILGLAVLGVVKSWSNRRPQIGFLLILFLLFTFFHALFFTNVRFRLPLDYFLIAISSHGLTTSGQFALSRRLKQKISSIRMVTPGIN